MKVALKKEVFVKMVLCVDTTRDDVDEAVMLVKKINKSIPVVLQPNSLELSKELLAKVRKLKKHCSAHLKRVEVIPQLHRITGVK